MPAIAWWPGRIQPGRTQEVRGEEWEVNGSPFSWPAGGNNRPLPNLQSCGWCQTSLQCHHRWDGHVSPSVPEPAGTHVCAHTHTHTLRPQYMTCILLTHYLTFNINSLSPLSLPPSLLCYRAGETTTCSTLALSLKSWAYQPSDGGSTRPTTILVGKADLPLLVVVCSTWVNTTLVKYNVLGLLNLSFPYSLSPFLHSSPPPPPLSLTQWPVS